MMHEDFKGSAHVDMAIQKVAAYPQLRVLVERSEGRTKVALLTT